MGGGEDINSDIRAEGMIRAMNAHGSDASKWKEIAKGCGFLSCYDEDFKKIFENYLLHPQTYYEFAIGDKKLNKYTEGLGTFVDQADRLVDHFQATVAGMDVAVEPNKHVLKNKAFKEIKKEDDDFVII
ncbi:hypothetical protein Tco_0014365 [Tanacetum coccineum]